MGCGMWEVSSRLSVAIKLIGLSVLTLLSAIGIILATAFNK